MEYGEIKKIRTIVKKHQDAFSIGLHTDSENKYSPRSEKYLAFNEGRRIRSNKKKV